MLLCFKHFIPPPPTTTTTADDDDDGLHCTFVLLIESLALMPVPSCCNTPTDRPSVLCLNYASSPSPPVDRRKRPATSEWKCHSERPVSNNINRVHNKHHRCDIWPQGGKGTPRNCCGQQKQVELGWWWWWYRQTGELSSDTIRDYKLVT